MRGIVAKRLRRQAEEATRGMKKEVTRKLYRRLKLGYKTRCCK